MKPVCHFHFIDDPGLTFLLSRAQVAHLIRTYLLDSRFSVSRVSAGVYHVRMSGHNVTAVIETK